MLRLFLILVVLCISNSIGFANERLISSNETSTCNQSGSSSEYNLCYHADFNFGIIGSSSKEPNAFPDLKKNLFSDYQIIDEIKSNGFYFTDPNLFFLIRKDHLYLNILRI